MSYKQDFVHLHSHSAWSMLDGISMTDVINETVAKKGFRALALTDHGSVSGVLNHLEDAKKNGINGIGGCEFYVVDDQKFRYDKEKGNERYEKRYHVIALAKSWEGFKDIQRMLTLAYSETGFYYKPRVSFEDFLTLKDCIVTSACVSGIASHPEYEQKFKDFNDAFGEDFLIEIQPHPIDIQLKTNAICMEMHKKLGRKLIATNDFHYLEKDHDVVQKVLLGIRDKTTKSSPNSWECISDLHCKTMQEMVKSFERLESMGSKITGDIVKTALFNTNEVADKCNLIIPKFEFTLPDIDTSELGTNDPDTALMKMCIKGWEEKLAFDRNSGEGKVYWERLLHELKIIYGKKFSKYFLLIKDIFKYCDSNKIAYGRGRGSVGGSLVCYLIGINGVDPIKYGLLFERFLTAERIDYPDIDLDFAHDRRDEVYQFMLKTYKNVAHIPVFSSMNTKGVIKDVSRYYEIPLEETNKISKEIDQNTSKQDIAGITIQKLEENPIKYPLYASFAKRNSTVISVSKVLQNQVRNAGVHAGGVIVSGVPLDERCALYFNKADSGLTINFDMYHTDKLGLLKVDVLGSKTVTIINLAVKLINETVSRFSEKRLVLDNIPLDDKATLSNFDKGNTVGVFQFESLGLQQLLKEFAPNNFDSIISANAIYRPGPLQFRSIYVRNKKNPHLIEKTGNEELDKIMIETFGVFVYQEQIMKICTLVAGLTSQEADSIRKKIAKSKGKEEMEKDRDKLVNGFINFGGISSQKANTIFDQIVDFGRYAFNKAHSTTYSLTSYYTMWLKTHFPNQFLCAQMAYTEDKEDRQKIKREIDRLGLSYLNPDINKSDRLCSIYREGKEIKILGGFNEIDGIGNAVIDEILKTRTNKEFSSYDDFMNSLENKRIINVGVQQKLLESGVFSNLHNRAYVNSKIELILANKNKKNVKQKEEELVSLF